MNATQIAIQLQSLPNEPGVYQYFDKDSKILYVGKAKNLKKRVSSYFTKNHDHNRTRLLVRKIARIEHIVVNSEMDALLLENNLIKKHQPRYNVMLKDDKSYPWICIKKEPFPRIFATRKLIKDGSEYFGPFTNVKTVYTLLDLIRELYPLRSCAYDLSDSKIASGKYKICLEYHLGNCLGPCEAKMEKAVYDQNIKAIKAIIKGSVKDPIASFKKQMTLHAEAMDFEKAQQAKEKLEALQNYQAKSTVVNPKIDNVDVFSVLSDETHGYINYIQVSHGAIIRSHTVEMKKKLQESDATLLRLAIVEMRQLFKSTSKEILIPIPLDLGLELEVAVPQRGDKKKLIDLSLRNAKFFRVERFKQMKIVDPERHTNRLMDQMKADLRLSERPYHIECFDNSNIQGAYPVAACVVFKNGKPSKKEYRKFAIKSVTGPDDFASMKEVVLRRYRRLLEQGDSLPQLIVIDGGKGQLSAALKSLDVLGLRGKIAIIGIAKRLEEIYFPGDSIPLYLDKRSDTLKIVQQLRNEAHRFGIQFHRNKRSKAAIHSSLDIIPGIGPATRAKLIGKFKSIKGIKEAKKEQFLELMGTRQGEKIYEAVREL